MAIEPLTAGLIGVAAGWAGQWFLIDRPIYRKVGDASSAQVEGATSAGAAVSVPEGVSDADLKAKLDFCMTQRAELEAKLAECTENCAQLKAELADTSAAFASVKKELGELRVVAPIAEVQPDDLELIDGIGPVFERKLYDAGIMTFAQLSECSEDRIREIIFPQKWQKIEPEKWIAEAAARAKRGE